MIDDSEKLYGMNRIKNNKVNYQDRYSVHEASFESAKYFYF